MGQIARELGASEQTVSAWVGGSRSPSGAARRALLAKYAIPEPAWDEVGKASPSVSLPRNPVEKVVAKASDPNLSALDRYRLELKAIEDDQAAAAADRAPWNHRAALHGQKLAAIDRLAKVEGVGVPVSAILKSEAWRLVFETVMGVLEDHPKIAKQMIAAVDALRAPVGS